MSSVASCIRPAVPTSFTPVPVAVMDSPSDSDGGPTDAARAHSRSGSQNLHPAPTSAPGSSATASTPNSSSTKLSSLPPLNTSQNRAGSRPRVPSYAGRRFSAMSHVSNISNHSQHSRSSRPQSTVFPMFHSHIPYALVRDFAYAQYDPMHYGPPPDASTSASTPMSELQRRLSDPPPTTWPGARGQWSAGPQETDANFFSGPRLPSTSYGDGPPWQEDDDLHSPIVTSSKHRRERSGGDYFEGYELTSDQEQQEGDFAGYNEDGRPTYYVNDNTERAANGPGGEFVTGAPRRRRDSSRRLRGGDTPMPPDLDAGDEDDLTPMDEFEHDESRYSRDYQFTIASPDEEMHGKAVALFDFQSEHDNELPLIEGQILWVSYRHGEGWLVAQDPKSGDTGLVPEEFVRLVRDIEGGLQGLNGHLESPIEETETPTVSSRVDHERASSSHSTGANSGLAYTTHFSTSSRDLHPYPQHLLTSPTSAPSMRRASSEESRKLAESPRPISSDSTTPTSAATSIPSTSNEVHR